MRSNEAGSKRQIGYVSLHQAHAGGLGRSGLDEVFGEEIDAREVLRPSPPLDKLPQPEAGVTPDFEDVLTFEAAHPQPVQQVEHPALPCLHDEQVARIKPGIKSPHWRRPYAALMRSVSAATLVYSIMAQVPPLRDLSP